MIIVDTAIWIDHLHQPVPLLDTALAHTAVMMHPFVLGEIALGSVRNRRVVLDELRSLAVAPVAFDPEVMMFIERYELHGSGIGYVDTHLLVAARLADGGALWTRDRRLHAAAMRVGVAWDPATFG